MAGTEGCVRRFCSLDSNRLVGSIALVSSTSKLRWFELEPDLLLWEVFSPRFFRFHFVLQDLRDWVSLCSFAISWVVFGFGFEMLVICWMLDSTLTWFACCYWISLVYIRIQFGFILIGLRVLGRLMLRICEKLDSGWFRAEVSTIDMIRVMT